MPTPQITAHRVALRLPGALRASASVRAWAQAAWRRADRLLLRVSAGLTAAAALVSADVLAGGALTRLDLAVHDWAIGSTGSALRVAADVVVLAGQRGPVAVVVAACAGLLAARRRSWWPVALPTAAVVALNVVVGALKLVTGRSAPYTGQDLFFAGGMEFPSGHAANSALMWGALAVVLGAGAARRRRALLTVGVVTTAALVGAACVVLDTHWLSDLLAGWLVGGALLAAITALLPRPRTTAAADAVREHRPTTAALVPAAGPRTVTVVTPGEER